MGQRAAGNREVCAEALPFCNLGAQARETQTQSIWARDGSGTDSPGNGGEAESERKGAKCGKYVYSCDRV